MRSGLRSYKFLIGVAVALAVVLWAMPERSAAQQNAMGHPVSSDYAPHRISIRFSRPYDGSRPWIGGGLGGLGGLGGGAAGLRGNMLVPAMPPTRHAAPLLHPLISLFGGAGGLGGFGGFGQQPQPWAAWTGHSSWVKSLAFSPDGRTLASTGFGGAVRLWEVCSGKQRAALKGHRGGACSVAFSPNGRLLASGGRDGAVQLWDSAGRARGSLKFPDGGRSWSVGCLCFSPGGTTLVAGGNFLELAGRLQVWDVEACKERFARGWHTVHAVAFSADGRMIAGGDGEGGVTLWDAATGKSRLPFEGHRGHVLAVAFVAGGLLASGGDDGVVRLWDVRARKQRAALQGHTDSVWCLSRSGRLLASGGSDKTIRLWDTVAQKQRLVLSLDAPVGSVAFRPDGRLLAVGDADGTIRVWSVAKLLARMNGK